MLHAACGLLSWALPSRSSCNLEEVLLQVAVLCIYTLLYRLAVGCFMGGGCQASVSCTPDLAEPGRWANLQPLPGQVALMSHSFVLAAGFAKDQRSLEKLIGELKEKGHV